MIDLEDRRERGKLLEQATPLVDAAHALHQDALRRRADDVVVLHWTEHDLELGFVPDERAVDCLFAAERTELCVDHLAVAEVDVCVGVTARQVEDAALPRHLERLQEVDDRHVGGRPREPRAAGEAAGRRDGLLGSPCQQEVDAREQLADEDRLGEVVLDAELETADFVLDRALAREEDDRDARPLGALLEAPHEGVAVELRQPGVGQDEVRCGQLQLGQGVEAVGRRGDGIPRLFEADLQDPHAPRIRVDQQELELRHGGTRIVAPALPVKECRWVGWSSAPLGEPSQRASRPRSSCRRCRS